MLITESDSSQVKLSICITTFNRANLIAATIASILPQLTDECEIVLLDAGSTDDTPSIVSTFLLRCNRLRYIRQETNGGWDRDCDRSVELANGEYCWLMTDDDLLKPGAVSYVLSAIQKKYCAVIVNVEARTLDMSTVVEDRCLPFASDCEYESTDIDSLFGDIGAMLTYVGCFVIQRAVWLQRNREDYYGSMFIHVGVIFQERLPGKSIVLSTPLVSYRMGNTHTWSSRTFHIFMVIWPQLVWSLDRSDAAKARTSSAEPWRKAGMLLRYRGRGCYSLHEYRQWVRPRLRSRHERLIPALVALLPGVLVNAACLLYFSVTRTERRGILLQLMRESPYYFRRWLSHEPE